MDGFFTKLPTIEAVEFFKPKFKPYVIGKIIKEKKSVILNGKIDWSK